MSITINSPFKAPPRISKPMWLTTIARAYPTPLFAGIPPEDRPAVAAAMYDEIVAAKHDPAIWLAVGQCEHSLGTNPVSVLYRNDTRSLTNARTVRDPSLTGWTLIRDAVRKSNYVKYQSVVDSLLDGIYRVDESGYAYRKAKAVSIIDHTMIWTEGDGPQYAAKMVAYINDLIASDTGKPPKPQPSGAQIAGFTWYPADADHYARGRTQKIRGGAQHYTAGTNSLNWLAKTSSPEVSVHFLVKHNPTMADRGWQLVKIEDTAWTTAFANPYTVAIEYEHDGKQSIPDAAYEVLAQTWADITDYVRRNSLGDIEKVAGHKVWVANPSLVCPDGIDVERIIKRWVELTATPQPVPSDALYFPETGYSISGGFHAYWEEFGGLPVYGYPITSEYDENGVRVQWFERARFEWHPGSWPERYDVLVGLVGVELLAARERIEELEETG